MYGVTHVDGFSVIIVGFVSMLVKSNTIKMNGSESRPREVELTCAQLKKPDYREDIYT